MSSLTYTIYPPIKSHLEPTVGLMLLFQDWDTALNKADKTTRLRELQKERGQKTDYVVICVSPTPVPHLQGFLWLFRSLQVSDGNYGSSPRKILMGTFASISANVAKSSWTPEGLYTMEEASCFIAWRPLLFTFQLTTKRLEISSVLFPHPTNWESCSDQVGFWRAWTVFYTWQHDLLKSNDLPKVTHKERDNWV